MRGLTGVKMSNDDADRVSRVITGIESDVARIHARLGKLLWNDPVSTLHAFVDPCGP